MEIEERQRCEYCGYELDRRVYFCQACSKPYKNVEALLAKPLPEYIDNEMLIRQNRKAWNVFFITLLALVFGAICEMMVSDGSGDTGHQVVSTIILFVVTLVLAILDWDLLKGQFKTTGFTKPIVWVLILALAPMLALNYGYHSLVENVFPFTDSAAYSELIDSKLALIVLVCVMPALVEEVAFRGLIQTHFAKTLSPRMAIFIASFLFSIMHFSFLSAPYLLLVGVLLGVLRHKSNSLYPPMLVHFLHNLVVVLYF